jgi:hypothetical protein
MDLSKIAAFLMTEDQTKVEKWRRCKRELRTTKLKCLPWCFTIQLSAKRIQGPIVESETFITGFEIRRSGQHFNLTLNVHTVVMQKVMEILLGENSRPSMTSHMLGVKNALHF